LWRRPPHAAITYVVAVAGIVALTSESLAAARDRHGAATTARAYGSHQSASTSTSPRIGRAGRDGSGRDRSFSGLASYYSEPQRLASGAAYDPSELTCAHRTLPFGTKLRVSDPKSGRTVVVTVNDRGPLARDRVLDLSFGAARALGMTDRGVILISASVLDGTSIGLPQQLP